MAFRLQTEDRRHVDHVEATPDAGGGVASRACLSRLPGYWPNWPFRRARALGPSPSTSTINAFQTANARLLLLSIVLTRLAYQVVPVQAASRSARSSSSQQLAAARPRAARLLAVRLVPISSPVPTLLLLLLLSPLAIACRAPVLPVFLGPLARLTLAHSRALQPVFLVADELTQLDFFMLRTVLLRS